MADVCARTDAGVACCRSEGDGFGALSYEFDMNGIQKRSR